MTANNVLLIDDDRTILVLYANFLSKEGITAYQADNAKMAVTTVMNVPIRLIITDINMPDMNGIVLAKQLKERYTSVPIIAMSALPFKDNKDALVEAGISGFLRKPVKRELFIETVKKYLI